MSIATLTFVNFRTTTSTTPPPPPAAVTDDPVAAPAPTPPTNRPDDGCACPPRRSSLADAVTQAAGGQADDAPGLRDAVMDFARALMQALRADESGPRDGRQPDQPDEVGEGDEHQRSRHARHHAHGHHRHHDDHGYRAMRGLGERIEALAQDLARPVDPPVSAPTAPPATMSPQSPGAEVQPRPASDDVPAAVTTPPIADAADAPVLQGTVLIAQFHVQSRSTPFAGWQDKLLDAFRDLRQASKAPDSGDDATLRNQLASFLYRLAHGLGDAEAGSLAAPTAPGALLDLAA